jgi:hypothetical protein
MAIPPLKLWLEQTNRNVFRPRSAELKILDEAIGKYETDKSPAALGKIKLAFEGWKKAKGPGWTMNERNKSGALSQLNTDLLAVQAVRFTPQELAALAFIAENRRNVIRNLFQGKQVVLKGLKSPKKAVEEAASDLKSKAEEAKAWLKSSGKTTPADAARIVKDKLEAMACEIFQVETLSTLGDLAGFVLDILEKCAVEVAPAVGHVKDGYDLFTGWAKVVSQAIERHDISKRAYVIDTGAPQAAFNALKQCLDKEIKAQAGEAGIATASFALKTGLVFADGGAISGPVVGALKAAANLAMKIGLLALEFRSTRRANELLKKSDLDIKLFETYPLLGCYLLTSATLSDVIPIKSFGQPGWMDYIETLKSRGFDGIYQAAEKLIDASLWEVRDMPKRRGKSTLPLGSLGAGGVAGDLKDIFG